MVQSNAICCREIDRVNISPIAGDPHSHPGLMAPYHQQQLPKVPSSSSRLGGKLRSRSRQLLRRAPSSAINLFEADLNQRLTHIGGSSGASLAAVGATVPFVDEQDRRLHAVRDEDDDPGLAFRIDPVHSNSSLGSPQQRLQSQEKKTKKLSEVKYNKTNINTTTLI
jgi:hypothetical protein